MFNGIIFYQGLVNKVLKTEKGINIFIYSKLKVSKKDLGMSISCDGVCLTLISYSNYSKDTTESYSTHYRSYCFNLTIIKE